MRNCVAGFLSWRSRTEVTWYANTLTQSEEDFCYFHMLCASLYPSTLFGISCNRQIQSDELINKGAQVTRSMVQKAVVVLATEVRAYAYAAHFWSAPRKIGNGDARVFCPARSQQC